jgi:hypothetical protein
VRTILKMRLKRVSQSVTLFVIKNGLGNERDRV